MVVLVGFMGAGKTEVGRKLARRMDLTFVDLDEEIERSAHASIREIFEARGERGFRELESAALIEIGRDADAVVATGGGIVEDAGNRALLERATVVFLDVSLDEALARCGEDASRPMLALADPRELHARRRPLYESVADLVVETTGRSVADVVEEIAKRLRKETAV